MNKAKLLRSSIRLANSFSTRHSGLTYHTLTQVTRSAFLTHFPPINSHVSTKTPFNSHQNLFFSSNTQQSFTNLILSNDWSENIEKKLEKLSPKLTHESVIYILINLSTNPQKSLDFFKWVCLRDGFEPRFSSYYVLLKTLACKEFMDEFWKVFLEMNKKGFYFDYKAYSVINIKLMYDKLSNESVEWTKRYRQMVEFDGEKELADEVLEIILKYDWGEDEVVTSLLKRRIVFPVNENFVLRLIAEMWQQPLKALSFFEWIRSCGGYEHDSVSYNAMAQVLGQEECVSEFWEFVKRMRSDGFDIDMYTYTRCCKHLPVKDAVELYELMMDGPYKPSLQHSITLLTKVSGEADTDMNLVSRVFDKIVTEGNTPTKTVYDGVHRAFCSIGRFDEAKKVVEDMKYFGYIPDNYTYYDEVSGLCKHGRLHEARKVLDHMEVVGCVPNVKTWTALIRGHCEAKQMRLALLCYTKMMKKNVYPDTKTFSVILDGFISENKLVDALAFFTELTKSELKVKPNLGSYILLIEKLSEAGKLEEIFHVLRMMKQQRYRVFPEPIIEYISKFGTVRDAKKLLEVLSPNDSIAPTVYGKVIKEFTKQGRYSEAQDIGDNSPPHVREHKVIRKLLSSNKAASFGTTS